MIKVALLYTHVHLGELFITIKYKCSCEMALKFIEIKNPLFNKKEMYGMNNMRCDKYH